MIVIQRDHTGSNNDTEEADSVPNQRQMIATKHRMENEATAKSSYETDDGAARAAGCEGEREVQLNRFRMSVAGVESVGCFGSTSRLKCPSQLCPEDILPMCAPSTIEVLQVATMRGIVKCHCEIRLNFGDNFEVVWYLKSLHICIDVFKR
jgi:hypothetical protein